ncbi:MAG: Mur ligase domain-containing protein, partial [Verrucomicrobiota bacterium]
MDATSLTQIAQWSGGVLLGENTGLVRRVVTDSRAATAGDLFVALKGERFDGHDYLEEVAARGVAGVLAQAGGGMRPAG